MTDGSTATHVAIQIKSAVPTFLVPDVAGTARWYLQHLGFGIAGTFPKQEPHACASLQRDAAEIMLLSLPDYAGSLGKTSRRPLGRIYPDAGSAQAV